VLLEYSLAGILKNRFVHHRFTVIDSNSEETTMLYWALVFLVVALIAGVLGFTGVAVAAAGVAKLLFVIFLVLFLISLVAHVGRGRGRSVN
jgi:uncharacterized membrane protein YtjA (UPF0391 family)